jgi:hypothetical protein
LEAFDAIFVMAAEAKGGAHVVEQLPADTRSLKGCGPINLSISSRIYRALPSLGAAPRTAAFRSPLGSLQAQRRPCRDGGSSKQHDAGAGGAVREDL